MKKTFSFFLIMLISIGISAQKKENKKQNTRKNKNFQTEATVVDLTYPSDSESKEIDTINIAGGKAYVFLINIDESNSQSVGDDQEEKELALNFQKDTFEVMKIYRYSYIIFGNGQTIDVSKLGNSYDAVAFWSGKNDDGIQAKEGRSKTTEFVAEQLGIKKESSYVINNREFKSEIEEVKNKNNFTAKSKVVLEAFLKRYSVPNICYIEKQTLVFNKNQEKVKSIKTIITERNNKKRIYEQILLNEKNQPVSFILFNSDGSPNNMNFEYQNDMLKHIKTNEKVISVGYDDDKIILSQNLGEADETEIFWIENGSLLTKSYTIMQDDNFSNMNIFSEEKIENNCVIEEINRIIWTRNCSSKDSTFPFIHSYTSYQDGNILQRKDHKIINKSETLYELFSKNSDNDDRELIPNGIFQLNDKGLLKSYNFPQNNEVKSIEIEYTYFP